MEEQKESLPIPPQLLQMQLTTEPAVSYIFFIMSSKNS